MSSVFYRAYGFLCKKGFALCKKMRGDGLDDDAHENRDSKTSCTAPARRAVHFM